MTEISITGCQDGAYVAFAKDMAIVASLRTTFPRARFSSCPKPGWTIPGKTALKRAIKWRDEIVAERQQAARLGRTLQARADELTGTPVRCVGEMKAQFTFEYDSDAVAALRSLEGARWDGRTWTVFPKDDAGVDAVIAAAKHVTSIIQAKRDAARATRAKEDAKKFERKMRRALVDVESLKVGDLVRGGRGVITISSFGSAFERGGTLVQYAYGDLVTDVVALDDFKRTESVALRRKRAE